VADRIKAVLYKDEGKTYEKIAEILFISHEGVRQHILDFKEKGGKLKPENGGSTEKLSPEQGLELKSYLNENIYTTASEIATYVFDKYKISYSERGMTDWLHRHNFSYHQPVGVPAKADETKQQEFLTHYESLINHLDPKDQVLFMDGVHPTHGVRFVKGWIQVGVRKEIPTNGTPKRINILGALNLETMKVYYKNFETINAQSVIAFFEKLQLEIKNGVIHVILDRAPYQRSKEVRAWNAKNPRIKLHFLPTASPNLNAIERLWKIMHENTTNNQYYKTFKDFSEKIFSFFDKIFPEKSSHYTSRLTDNFRTVKSFKN
jgi:transposase